MNKAMLVQNINICDLFFKKIDLRILNSGACVSLVVEVTVQRDKLHFSNYFDMSMNSVNSGSNAAFANSNAF